MESSIGRGGLERVSAAGLGVEVEAQRVRRAVTTRDDMLRFGRAFTALKATLDDERYISTKLGESSKICPLYSAEFNKIGSQPSIRSRDPRHFLPAVIHGCRTSLPLF